MKTISLSEFESNLLDYAQEVTFKLTQRNSLHFDILFLLAFESKFYLLDSVI